MTARIAAVAIAVAVAAAPSGAGAGGIHSNTALSPGRGQFVYRGQLRFHRLVGGGDTAVAADRLAIVNVGLWAVHERLAIIGVVPLVAQTGTARPPAPGEAVDLDDIGAGDARVMAKLRLLSTDGRGSTARVAAVAGAVVPSHDAPFSSESYGAIAGVVATLQTLERSIDVDAAWTFATGDGARGDDALAYDAAYTHTLITDQSMDGDIWQLRAVIEVNGSSTTGGRHMVFASPGLVLVLPEIAVELSAQVPVVRDLGGDIAPGTVAVAGFRRTW
ncbi:MAG: hypothetical protein D6689_00025 [Deltaproteobacteria bacterium]|nr:MAG: hypothetical protein D6689_00025 [Deltaproteobacteria bacterium]